MLANPDLPSAASIDYSQALNDMARDRAYHFNVLVE
jgi:hypothetical protein